MPPFPDELEEWWLTDGRDSLRRLVETSQTGLKPQNSGFAQAIQHRLRVFDNDRPTQRELTRRVPEIHKSRQHDFGDNPRKA